MGQNLASRTRQNVNQRGASSPPATRPDAGQQDKPLTIGQTIMRMQSEIARALPKHMDADRMARLALTAVRKTPKLAQCTPESFAGSLLTASALGLEPGVNEECYLVPYRDTKKGITECQLIVGYQGYAKMFYQSPLGLHLAAQAVYEADDFEYEYGTNAYLRHKPARGNRGQITDYYATATLRTGATPFVVLSPEEVRQLRRGKEGPSGDIPDPQRWMERKTVIRQLVKLLPKSATMSAVVAADERPGSELFRERLAERNAVADDVIDLTPPALDAPEDDPAPDTDLEVAATNSVPDPAATPAQLRKLNLLMEQDGSTGDSEKLHYLGEQFKRTFTSQKELTRAEASALIEFLENPPAPDDGERLPMDGQEGGE